VLERQRICDPLLWGSGLGGSTKWSGSVALWELWVDPRRQGPFYVGSVGLGPVCVIEMDGVGSGQTKGGMGGKLARSVRATLSHFFGGNEGGGLGKLVPRTDHIRSQSLSCRGECFPVWSGACINSECRAIASAQFCFSGTANLQLALAVDPG
jgi:hypothetical protein